MLARVITALFDLTAAPAARLADLAPAIYAAAWRTDLDHPGFAALDLGAVASGQVRGLMLDLHARLDGLNRERRGEGFAIRSLGRFDQQTTTRLHRDGAPDRSLLVLGYEASPVASRLVMADFARAAHEAQLDPRRFLDEFNPMYRRGAERLAPHATELPNAPSGHARIVLINNSALPFDPAGQAPLGVLHGATIDRPDPAARRIINSMMLVEGEADAVDAALIHAFATTDAISGPMVG